MHNDNLGWWASIESGSTERGRSLACAFHAAYHRSMIYPANQISWVFSDHTGRFHHRTILRLEMERVIAAAKAWCLNSFTDSEYGHAFADIATRLPEKWAKSPQRRALALRAFEVLCEDNRVHESGALTELAADLGRSTDAVQRDRLDFFVFAAACALDDETWNHAMKEKG